MPGQKRLAGALAAVAAAMVVSACGSSSDNQTIPQENADKLISELNAVQDAIDSRKCDLAQQEAQAFVDEVNQLPATVGTDDKDKLRNAGENLVELASKPSQCKPPPPKTGTTDLGGVDTTTTPPEETTTTSTTTSSTTTTSTQPSGGGGNEGNGGGSSNSGGGGGQTGGGGGGQTGGGGEAGGGSGGTGGTGTGGTGGGTG